MNAASSLSHPLPVISIDSSILELIKKPLWSARVHSCYHQAVNLVDRRDNLIVLLLSPAFNGPNRIIIDILRPFSFKSSSGLKTGDCFVRDGCLLRSYPSNFTVNAAEPQVWSDKWKVRGLLPSGRVIYKSLIRAMDFLVENTKADERTLFCTCRDLLSGSNTISQSGAASLDNRLIGICSRAFEGVRGGNSLSLKSAINDFIGLGRGLTPSGDDIIAGLINALFFLKRFTIEQEAPFLDVLKWFGQLVDECQTTFISYQFLRWTSMGRMGQEVLSLCDVLLYGEESELEQIGRNFLEIGATSGREIMLGIIIGLSSLLPPGHYR